MSESISGRLWKVMGGQGRPWGVIRGMGGHRSHGKPWGGGSIGSHWEPWKAIGGYGKPLGNHERLWEATGGYENPLGARKAMGIVEGYGRPWGGHGRPWGGRGEPMGGHTCSLFAFCPVSFSQPLISVPLPNPVIFVRENEWEEALPTVPSPSQHYLVLEFPILEETQVILPFQIISINVAKVYLRTEKVSLRLPRFWS